MNAFLQSVTDRVSSKRGMWTTLAIWLALTVLLAILAPSAKDYETSSISSLPSDAKSVLAQKKADHYFKGNDGLPAILVFQAEHKEIMLSQFETFLKEIQQMDGIKEAVPITTMPPQAAENFISKDGSTVLLPLTFEPSLETKEIRILLDQITELNKNSTDLTLYITGPAGIAVDILNLFSRADLVLLLSTVVLILILLIVIYRSPLLALIPLLAAAFVYEVVNGALGIMGKAGLQVSSQTFSIMTILLFAAVIDYSLFVFSRYREELKKHESKFNAMQLAMRETGLPVFFSGGTVLAAMLVLFFAKSGDYRNFAPVFATAMLIIMLASITLVPALFALFGRKSFWPRIPRVGDKTAAAKSVWGRIGHFVVRKPVLSIVVIGVILLAAALNMFNLKYEFDTIKSFPENMSSRMGYEILEEKFEKGDLAPTTVLFEADEPVSSRQQGALLKELSDQPLVSTVRPNGVSADDKVIQYDLTFTENPYAAETMDALEKMRNKSSELLEGSNLEGELHFAGETAEKVDDRAANDRDLVVIVLLESLLIFILLIILTRSIKMPIYMMGTILISFLAAVGLGMFLSSLFFDIAAISNRVPLYAFVFLVALGIDYNIMLISRFIEERGKYSVKEAVEIAVSNTGGVISSAGIILAATFAVLMTQPIQLLFVFGFIVAVGILLDTFLIRGILLPALIVLLEKDTASVKERAASK
ncbi:MMPL family transporter [Peribacillus deserti]|uniref:MMPL domain-containing protein n=1 Tax=Peribacillus deserti TaxID=673318 RepID=A0A2N5M5Q9_9BACI|nr:MMPL family transporter [Peribacillus deserti]PLT29689.1 MMPL domain-containing protein [Peribacillus deserti]